MAPEMGRSRFTIIKLLFACFIYCCLSAIIDQHPNPASYQFAQALVYHKYQPATPVLSRVNRQPANISASDSFYHNYQVPAYNRQQQQQQQLQKQQPPISYLTSSESSDESEFYGCPRECHCNDVAHIADCSDRNLTRVPARFPKDIRRIRLERNNITEIGPFAFQGLKRLQRIDLSNNNLHKIDTLAFSGGLQTLNTLILFNNKLEHLPVNVFSELSNLQILLLNANSLQTIHKDLFQSLTSLNLLSLYDNNIVSLASGTFDALKNVKTIHLGKNPLNCDCSLRWIVDYFEANPTVETSEASCKLPVKSQGLRLTQLNKNDMKCQEPVPSRGPIGADLPSSCPAGCVCSGSTVDCSRVSPSGPLAAESPALGAPGGGLYELPDVPEDLPVYVARVHINDNRIKRIRQTGLFKKLANSQKLDLGNNKIVDIEDNAINGHLPNGQKPERVIFVLLENQHCENVNVTNKRTANNHLSSDGPTTRSGLQHDSSDDDRQTACATAPKVNDPVFDSPCYNGGTCRSDGSHSNFTCQCPLGFGGPLCEINIDDCVDHQCQNGAMCVDGINSYKCICRDPTTSGEFCEQLSSATNNNLYNSLGASFGMPYNPTSGASSSNAIAPLALPIIAQASNAGLVSQSNDLSPSEQQHRSHQPQILARSADFLRQPDDLASNSLQQSNAGIGKGEKTCHRATSSKYFDDGNGCQSVRLLKISECVGACDSKSGGGCCAPTKIKRRRIHMQCSDGASYVKVVDLIKKCSCSQEANSCPAALNDLLPVSQSTTRGAPLSFAPSVRTSTRSPPTTTTALYQQYYKYSTGSDQQVPPSPVVNRGQLNGGASSQEDQITQLDAVE